jgi:VWFA-related protein
MTRVFIALALVASTAPAGPQSQASIQASLVIDAVAFDRNDRPVMDLKREEIEVWIAGYRVPIDSLTAVTASDERAARSIVLILDNVTLHPAMAARVKEIARRFVNRLLPGDEMSIVTFDGGSMEITADRKQLDEGIDAYNVRASGVRRIDELGEQVLNQAASISRQLARPQDRRKTIVALGAAFLFDTPLPPPSAGRELRQEWTDAVRAMAFSNVSFYVIEPGGVGATPLIGGDSGFARESGGRAFVNTNDFAGAVDRVMREAGNYYVIEVGDPPVQRKADLRELDVKVLRPGVTIRARKAIPGTGAAPRRK